MGVTFTGTFVLPQRHWIRDYDALRYKDKSYGCNPMINTGFLEEMACILTVQGNNQKSLDAFTREQ